MIAMKLSKAVTWCTRVALRQKRCTWWSLCHGNVRSIYSKTGIWKSQLNLVTRLEIEDHWRPLIQQHDTELSERINASDDAHKEKFYALSMFPYPSGNLHLGHVRVYTISDVMARYQRSQGKHVIHPMGWDAFGLPAENAAIERGIHPKEWTYSNIKRMKEQLQSFSFSFDWNREVTTCDPSYYRWTQYIFLKMHEKGLAFQKKGLVNWDPVDMTVLAEEQIDDNGCSWRSGAKVEKKYLTQWYLRDTIFSESLLEGLEEVDEELWRDIILLQNNWISELKGHRIDFVVKYESAKTEVTLTIYTQHLDLIYGVSHLCVKPSHHLCMDLGIQNIGAVLPAYAVHPFTGQHLKLVVTDESLMYPDRDTMLAIPCISEEDRATADKLDIPYTDVLDSTFNILQNSNELDGLTRQEAVEVVRQKALPVGIGGERISEKLNDWLISRQRYWGTPIPIIHCKKCGSVPVPYKDLPVELPDTEKISNKGGRSPLCDELSWVNVSCPQCGANAKRETDTMDTFVDSTWYFLRYLDPHNENLPFDPDKASQFMPVDLYVGGKEHALLHLYFARFVCHFLYSVGMLEKREPFVNLLTQGMVRGESFRVKSTGKYLTRDQVDWSGKVPVKAGTGEEVVVEWEKMSKSKHNGVNPEDVLAEYGVDSTRLCILSNVSPQSDRNWSQIVYKGVISWQGRIWSLVSNYRKYYLGGLTGEKDDFTPEELKEWEHKINDTRNHIVNHVNYQMDHTFHINAAISRLHSYVSWLLKVPPQVAYSSKAYERALGDLIVMVSPMAPHFTSELWVGLKEVVQHSTHQWDKNVLEQQWPKLDADFLMPLTCRVNNVDILEVGIPYKDLDNLDEAAAFQEVLKDSIFQEQFAHLSIQKASLKVTKGHKALLSLSIPGYDFGIEGSAAEKRKKEKKLGKQRKKLHTMDSG